MDILEGDRGGGSGESRNRTQCKWNQANCWPCDERGKDSVPMEFSGLELNPFDGNSCPFDNNTLGNWLALGL